MRVFHLLALAAVAAFLPIGSAEVAARDGAEATVDPKDRMVCKRTQRTGTRFYDKICKTAGQWEAIAEQHRRNASEMIDRPQIEIRRDN